MSALADRLRALGFDASDIARRTGISLDRATALLEGASATLAEAREIAARLNLPVSAFSRAPAENEAIQMLFRGTDSSGPVEPTHYKARRFVDAALQVLPKREAVPAWLASMTAKEETYGEAERLADEFRKLFYADRLDDPALDLAIVLSKAAGVVVGRLRQSRYEGGSLIAGGYPFILVSPRYVPRMLFTVAHELGHLIAHHSADTAPIFETSSTIAYGKRRSLKEHFVDAFASVLLLPKVGVATALGKIRQLLNVGGDKIGDIELLLLARIFGVSFEVAARRCEDLELLPTGAARSFLEQIKQDYGNPEKRADAVGLPARPPISLPPLSSNLLEAIVRKVRSGEQSIGWAADRFAVSIDTINAANAEMRREVHH